MSVEPAATFLSLAPEIAGRVRLGLAVLDGVTVREIGRASCRERVYHPV